MRGRGLSAAAMLLATLGAGLFAGASSLPGQTAVRLAYGMQPGIGYRYPKRTPNWTNARYRRAAQKRRNILRNRRR